MMFETCLQKQQELIALFSDCVTSEEKYHKIIQLGKTQGKLAPEYKQEPYRVLGCQSQMYLHTWCDEKGHVRMETESDALISAGLAMLLHVYDNETPETILKCPPTHLETLGIQKALTPGRSNGLASLYIRLKQDALRHYMEGSKRTG